MTDDTDGAKAIEAAVEALTGKPIDAVPIGEQTIARRTIRAYLAALPGWRLVPVEPTELMHSSCALVFGFNPNELPTEMKERARLGLKEMISAAPNPPGLHSEDGES